eukprot:scaffold255243_cov48-Attheya_sp.AAC.1
MSEAVPTRVRDTHTRAPYNLPWERDRGPICPPRPPIPWEGLLCAIRKSAHLAWHAFWAYFFHGTYLRPREDFVADHPSLARAAARWGRPSDGRLFLLRPPYLYPGSVRLCPRFLL